MIEQSILDGLKAKHGGKLRIITVDRGDEGKTDFVAKKPTRAEWKRFVGLLSDDDTKGDAFDSIFVNSVVYPENAEGVLDEDPGLAMTVGNKVAEWVGLTKKAEAKKA